MKHAARKLLWSRKIVLFQNSQLHYVSRSCIFGGCWWHYRQGHFTITLSVLADSQAWRASVNPWGTFCGERQMGRLNCVCIQVQSIEELAACPGYDRLFWWSYRVFYSLIKWESLIWKQVLPCRKWGNPQWRPIDSWMAPRGRVLSSADHSVDKKPDERYRNWVTALEDIVWDKCNRNI
jgi:hypothetical protein